MRFPPIFAAPCSTRTSPAWSRARTEAVRDHRQRGGCHQAGGPRRRLRCRRRVRSSRRTRCSPSTVSRRLAIGAGIDALRDAGIPLVMRYKTTTMGTQLPDRWVLPEAMRDDTGVIFASAFPGCNSFADEMSRYHIDRTRREQLAMLQNLQARAAEVNGHSKLGAGDRSGASGAARCRREGSIYLQSPLPAQGPADGTFAIRRVHRRPGAEHPDQLPPAPAPRKPSAWRKTGSGPGAAAGW